jgi:uncharacterized phage protein (predicted DNA packaging)
MIELGDPLPDLGIDVYDETGSPSDGGAVSLNITRDGVQLAGGGPGSAGGTLLTITHPGAGQYTSSYTPLVTGQLVARWVVTGANAGAKTTLYEVEDPAVGIVGLDEVKQHLRINRIADDEILDRLILEASDLCESTQGTGKTWRRTVVTDEVHNANGAAIYLHRSPVTSITAITVDGVSQDVSAVDVTSGGILTSLTGFYSSRPGTMKVSYVAGGGPVPSAIRGGVLEMVRYLYGMHRGGSNLPRQEEPDFNVQAGYLLPNRVKMAWRSDDALGF